MQVDVISSQCFGAYTRLVGSRRQGILLAGRLRKHFHVHVHAWKLSSSSSADTIPRTRLLTTMATQAPAVHFAPSRGPGRGQAGENCARSPDNPRKTRPCLPLPTQSISGRHLTLGVRVTAIAVEPCSEEDLTWNSEYFKRTGRLLGSVDTSRLKALSLADNHTNCVLRCLLQQVAHTRDETLCHNGRLSLELLSKRDQGLHKAVINGVPWKFTSKDVALQLPHHLSLVQRMGNATLQRAEHELQFMRRLRQLWISHSHGESQPDFAMMKKKTTTGKTVHSKVPPFLYQFALKAAGGRDPSLLNKTESFVRLHSPSTRSLGREFWEKVVAEGAKGSNQVVCFRPAMVTCIA